MRRLPLALLGLLAACASDPPARARQSVRPAPPLAEQVRELELQARPGPEHRALERLAGSWRIRMLEVGRGGAEHEFTRGTATIEVVHDGRFLDWRGELEGVGSFGLYLGYDSARGHYQLLQISNRTTGMGLADGTGDLDERGIVFQQDVFDPTAGRFMRMKTSMRLLGPDRLVVEVLVPDERGRDRPARRLEYAREPTR